MVWRRANRFQQYIKMPKKVTMEVMRLRTLKVKKPIIKGVQAKLKILIEEDI